MGGKRDSMYVLGPHPGSQQEPAYIQGLGVGSYPKRGTRGGFKPTQSWEAGSEVEWPQHQVAETDLRASLGGTRVDRLSEKVVKNSCWAFTEGMSEPVRAGTLSWSRMDSAETMVWVEVLIPEEPRT